MMRSVPGGSSASGAHGKRCVGVDLPANGSNFCGQPNPRLSMSPTCTSSSASLAFFCSRCVAAQSGGRSRTGCFTLLSRRMASSGGDDHLVQRGLFLFGRGLRIGDHFVVFVLRPHHVGLAQALLVAFRRHLLDGLELPIGLGIQLFSFFLGFARRFALRAFLLALGHRAFERIGFVVRVRCFGLRIGGGRGFSRRPRPSCHSRRAARTSKERRRTTKEHETCITSRSCTATRTVRWTVHSSKLHSAARRILCMAM